MMTTTECPGLTLDEALSDPLVRAVMHADGIDLPRFEAFLRRTAGALAQRRGTDGGMVAEALAC